MEKKEKTYCPEEDGFVARIGIPASKQKFPLGRCVMTAGIAGELEASEKEEPGSRDKNITLQDVSSFIVRHALGDWGDLCPEDLEANERALEHGSRLFSSYETENKSTVWVITEWDRSATTVLFPSEY